MKNTRKYPTESLAQSSQASIKNKARLSTMTAFSFGYHLNQLKTDQSYLFRKVTIRVFFLRFTSQNETSKSFLIPTLKTPLIRMQWQPLTKGGNVLFRLLVAV
jgi:hypothetical protein